jgi:hypothetical protein
MTQIQTHMNFARFFRRISYEIEPVNLAGIK